MRKKFYIILVVIILLILSTFTLVTGTDLLRDSISDTIENQLDNIKSITETSDDGIPNKYPVESIEVSGFDELKTAIETNSRKIENKSVIVNLNDGDYNVTDTIKVGSYRTDMQFTINGNGHTIDGQNQHEFIELFGDLNINDLTIQNTIPGESNASGAITMESVSSLYVNNCQFINNNGKIKGSTITNRGNTTVRNSIFINNTVEETGGAIWSTGEYEGCLIVEDSTFKENYANMHENHEKTAIIYMVSDGNNIIKNNEFKNNNGRCIHSYNHTNTSIMDNNFIDNTLVDSDVIRGGIIDNYESDIIIKNNEFTNDITEGELRGGIIYHEIGYLEFTDNKVNNYHIDYDPSSTTACSKGGVIFNRNATIKVENNVFNNTMVGNYSRGGVIFNNLGVVNLKNNKFTNTVDGSDVRGIIVFNDVNSILNVENNTYESKDLRSVNSIDENKFFNSKVQNEEGSGTIGIVNYY